MEKKGVIIRHMSSLMYPAFDVLVKKEYEKEFEKYKEDFYSIDCSYVEEFLKENPDYIYLGSEDLGHYEPINEYLKSVIKELRKAGFEIIEKN